MQQLLNAEPAEREVMLAQHALILPQLALFAEVIAQNQPEVAPYLLPLVQEMKARVTLPPVSASGIKLTLAQTPTATARETEAKDASSQAVVGYGELQMTSISSSQPPIDESRLGKITQPLEPMPRLLRLTIAGQKV